jgi:hypothetical protein
MKRSDIVCRLCASAEEEHACGGTEARRNGGNGGTEVRRHGAASYIASALVLGTLALAHPRSPYGPEAASIMQEAAHPLSPLCPLSPLSPLSPYPGGGGEELLLKGSDKETVLLRPSASV